MIADETIKQAATEQIIRKTSELLNLLESPMQYEDTIGRAFWEQSVWAAKSQLRYLIAELND